MIFRISYVDPDLGVYVVTADAPRGEGSEPARVNRRTEDGSARWAGRSAGGRGLAAKSARGAKNGRCHRGHGARTPRKQETDRSGGPCAPRAAEGWPRRGARGAKNGVGVLSQRSRSADTEEAGDGRTEDGFYRRERRERRLIFYPRYPRNPWLKSSESWPRRGARGAEVGGQTAPKVGRALGDRSANGAGQSKPGATPQEIAGRQAED